MWALDLGKVESLNAEKEASHRLGVSMQDLLFCCQNELRTHSRQPNPMLEQWGWTGTLADPCGPQRLSKTNAEDKNGGAGSTEPKPALPPLWTGLGVMALFHEGLEELGGQAGRVQRLFSQQIPVEVQCTSAVARTVLNSKKTTTTCPVQQIPETTPHVTDGIWWPGRGQLRVLQDSGFPEAGPGESSGP